MMMIMVMMIYVKEHRLTPWRTYLLEKMHSCQEITCYLWNPKIYHHIHDSLPLVSILNKI